MKISELIEKLIDIHKEHGDLTVCISEEHEYWGSYQSQISEGYNFAVKQAQPDGPKSGKQELCVVFGK